MRAARLPATTADGITLQMFAARRAFPADEGHRLDSAKKAAHGRHKCACGAPDRDWWHYICHCPTVAEARARLRVTASAACKAFEGDVAEGTWRRARHSLDAGPRDATSERDLILAIAVGLPSELSAAREATLRGSSATFTRPPPPS
jgi:hypothetical protein